MEYQIRIERVGNELVLHFRREDARWREATRELFDTIEDARGEAVRLDHSTPREVLEAFEAWGCKLPEALRAPGVRIRRP